MRLILDGICFGESVEDFLNVYDELRMARSKQPVYPLLLKHKRKIIKWLESQISGSLKRFLPVIEKRSVVDLLVFMKGLLNQPENLSLSQVIGREREISYIKERIESILSARRRFKDLFQRYSTSEGEGIFLFGPPGCGKTYLSKALASHYKLFFVEVHASDFFPSKLANRIKLAKILKDALLFIDDVDLVFASRDFYSKDLVLKELMSLISGEEVPFFYVIATNYPEKIDNALLRAGRFSNYFYISLPSRKEREKLFAFYLQNNPLEDINYSLLAEESMLFTPAEIKEASKRAIKKAMHIALKNAEVEPVRNEYVLEAIRQIKPVAISWYLEKLKNIDKLSLFPELVEDIKEKKNFVIDLDRGMYG